MKKIYCVICGKYKKYEKTSPAIGLNISPIASGIKKHKSL